MDTDIPQSNETARSPPSSTTTTSTTAPKTASPPSSTATIKSPPRPSLSDSIPASRPSTSNAILSPPRPPAVTADNAARTTSRTIVQHGQDPSPQRTTSISPHHFRDARDSSASYPVSNPVGPSSSGPSRGFASSSSLGAPGPDQTRTQLAEMLASAYNDLEILRTNYAHEKRLANYWENMAKSYGAIGDVYGGLTNGDGHGRSPELSPTSIHATNQSMRHALESCPKPIIDLIEHLNKTIWKAECERDEERARRVMIFDYWRQFKEQLEAIDMRTRELHDNVYSKVLVLNGATPLSELGYEVERHSPVSREGFLYDAEGRLVGRSTQMPLHDTRGPPYVVMGPPPPPDTKPPRKRRGGSVEPSSNKKMRVHQYPNPAPIPPHPAGPGAASQPHGSSHVYPTHPHGPPVHIPPPPPPQPHQQPPYDVSSQAGQFLNWTPPGQPTSSKQANQQPLFTTFNSRERDRPDRDKGRPEREPERGRERAAHHDRSNTPSGPVAHGEARRGRERSHSVSSDKSLDDMLIDATVSGAGGPQLPPMRPYPSSNRHSSAELNVDRERDQDKDHHQHRSSPSRDHYLPPPRSQKMYSHPPPPGGGYSYEGRGGERSNEGVLRGELRGETSQGADPQHHYAYGSSPRLTHALTAQPTIPNVGAHSSIPTSSLVSHPSSHSTIANSSVASIPAANSQLSLVQPGTFPPTNANGQRICRQCGQPGRYKEGKCVEKWGPGPHGPGTVCDRCRKKMKRVERRGTIEQTQAVAAAQAQAARQQAAVHARAEAARLEEERHHQHRLRAREQSREDDPWRGEERERRPLTRGDTIVVPNHVPPSEHGGGVVSYRRDPGREYSPLPSEELPLPRTIIPSPGSFRGSPLPRSSSHHPSPSHRSGGSRSGSGGEDADADADGDLDDGDGEGEPGLHRVRGQDVPPSPPNHVEVVNNITARRSGSGESPSSPKGSQRSGGSVDRPRSGDPEVDLLEAVDAAEQAGPSEA